MGRSEQKSEDEEESESSELEEIDTEEFVDSETESLKMNEASDLIENHEIDLPAETSEIMTNMSDDSQNHCKTCFKLEAENKELKTENQAFKNRLDGSETDREIKHLKAENSI